MTEIIYTFSSRILFQSGRQYGGDNLLLFKGKDKMSEIIYTFSTHTFYKGKGKMAVNIYIFDTRRFLKVEDKMVK